jgi:FkbH-like protein
MSENVANASTAPFQITAEAKRLWRSYCRDVSNGDQTATLRIGLSASFTAETLVPFLGAHLIVNQLPPAILVGPYNQLFQTCLAPQSVFGNICDVIALLWRLEDLVLEEINAFLHGDRSAVARASEKTSSFAAAIAQLRDNFQGTVIVSVPPFPTGVSTGLSSLDNAEVLGAFHRALVAGFIEQVESTAGVRLLDLDAIQREVGFLKSFDGRQWYLYRAPFTESFLHEAGKTLGRIIVATRRAGKKCVVLDCDNTLWGGIVGEDGIDGIEIGDDFPGSAYRDFQRLILYWRSQGVLVALASKNNESDVWGVFDRHDGMVLKREHISAWQINWRPKADNIELIAKALNIGLDTLVFIDDSAMEVAHMQSARPEVTSIQLPAEPADVLSVMRGLTLFDRLEVTVEDRTRADMMRAEIDREAAAANISHGEFLQAMDLRVDLFMARAEDLGRITQLINKTNQFNLTTVRRTLDEVRSLSASPDFRIYGVRVNDKFGEYGLTGVIIVCVAPDPHRWVVDSLLLSCRVLGRGVETGLVGALADDGRATGITEIVASFVPTQKNGLCASFLADHGFVQVSDQQWLLALSNAPAVPAHITRVQTNNPPVVAAA